MNQALARHVITDPETFIAQTTAQIAHASGVSAASVIRFVRQFEFADLQSFKPALAREKTLPAEVMPLDPLVQDDDDLSTMMHKLSQTAIAAVRDLPDELDQSAVQSAITTLRQARHIYLVGVSASALVAQDLYLKLIRAGYVAILTTTPTRRWSALIIRHRPMPWSFFIQRFDQRGRIGGSASAAKPNAGNCSDTTRAESVA